MDDLETLLKKLQTQAIEDAARIDPSIKEKLEEDRREIEQHEKRLEAQRLASQKAEPPKEYKDLWDKMKPQ